MKVNLREEARKVKEKMYKGIYTYDEAQKALQPFIDLANQQGEMIAKKHGKRFMKFTFISVIR